MHAPRILHSLDVKTSAWLDWRELYLQLRERAWVVVLCLLAAGLATATVLERSPRIYAASSVLLVEDEDPKVVDIQHVQQDEYQSIEALKTVEQRLQSRGLLERVIDANHLDQDPRLMADLPAPVADRDRLVSRLQAMVTVRLRRGTRLIDITVEHTDPTLAALVANSLVTEFLRQDYEQGASTLHDANTYLESEAGEIKAKLDDSENALQVYREKTHAVSATDTQNTVTQALDELSIKATEAKSQRIASETAYREVLALGSNVDALLVTPAADSNAAIEEIRSNITKAESALADLKPRYKPKHPKYMEAESQLAGWKRALNEALLQLPQTAQSAYESAKAAEAALDDALRQQQGVALDMNRSAIQYDVLARDVESNRALYQTVLNQVKENTVIKDLKTTNIRVVERAEPPDKPVRPDKVKVLLAGLFGGIVASGVMIFGLNALDSSLKAVGETESCLGLPVLSAIPKCDAQDGEPASKIEAFRTLRTALSTLASREEKRVLLFTSSLPGEGKTFCSLNYAFSLVQQGLSTLVIDGDMRRPMIEKILRASNERSVGLTDYLSKQKRLREIVNTTKFDNLFFIASGSDADNPVELLTRPEFRQLIREALTIFDRVVIDSAPLNVVSDTFLILGCVETVCLVVRANRTPKAAAQRTVDLLNQAEAPLAGVILNLVRPETGNGYYYDDSYRGRYGETVR